MACSTAEIASRLQFGPQAIGAVEFHVPNSAYRGQELSRHAVVLLVLASVGEDRHLQGEQGTVVTERLADIYAHGLHTYGAHDSHVNCEVLPALRSIMDELSQKPAKSHKRVQAMRALVRACCDCQQVQARTILRVYGDLTNQTQTLESQLKYSLRLMPGISVKDWLQTLLADINNQAKDADRLIDRECIFKWVEANMSQEERHCIFYDETRPFEYEDLDVQKPTEVNRFEPFLSCWVLVDVLLRAGMVEKSIPPPEPTIVCRHCGLRLPSGSASRAHLAICEECRLQRSREPVDVAVRLVEGARVAGSAFPDTFYTAREVCNYDLAVSFARQLQEFNRRGCSGTQTKPEIVYHWTQERNIRNIMENSLLVAGESNTDGSRVSQAHGKVHGAGIYAYDNINDGECYGRGAPCALLCLALPGRVLHGRYLKAQDGYDSLVNSKMRVYARSSQLLPLYLTNKSNDMLAREAAANVLAILEQCG